MIEFDVRHTRDDRPVCFHDADVAGTPLDQLNRDDVARATESCFRLSLAGRHP